jgi:hypothetical protein
MDNQHCMIKGYRDLDAHEVATINMIKEHGVLLAALVQHVQRHIADQYEVLRGDAPEHDLRQHPRCHAEPERWCSIARTHLQEGLSALTRAVAQPEFF